MSSLELQTFQEQYGIRLNEQQAAAVQAVDGPVLLLAVPGSGKTTALVARLGYMILCRGIDPARILTMTYTVAATRDMRERFARVFGRELAAQLEFRTINGVSARIIRAFEQHTGRTAFRLQEDEGRLAGLIGEIYRGIHKEYPTESTVKTIRTAITYIKNMLLTPEEIRKLQPDGIDIAPIFEAYRETLIRCREMDYDDQMVYARQILQTNPEILARFQRQYRYFCVDEAQDTSRIQHEIIHILARDTGNVFMVGDEDQSIYGFRAAYPEALLDFEHSYPGGRVLLLEQNFRSTGEIVRCAVRFISKSEGRRPKLMRGTGRSGPEPMQIPVSDRHAQYTFLAELAAKCTTETAVLYRNNDSALPLIDLLARAGTPYRCRQFDPGFFTHRIVRDVTDTIRLAFDPTDRELFLRLYYKWGVRIAKAAALEVTGRGRCDYLSELCMSANLQPRVRAQCRLLRSELEKLKTDRADEAVYRIAYHIGYIHYLENRGYDTSKLGILRSIGASEPSAHRLLLRLEELKELVQQGSTGAKDCPFILSTIHSSKGLEYRNVILLDVLDGILPAQVPTPGKPDPDELRAYQEERRIFYVGITRAKDRLAILSLPREEGRASFTEELFPPEPPKRQTTQAKTGRTSGAFFRKASYAPGMRIVHAKYGPGQIRTLEGDLATIDFDTEQSRLFSLKSLKKLHLIRPEE